MSDDGSDDNDCHSASAPCRNLQIVLDRAADGADIYVTSQTLSLDSNKKQIDYWDYCIINSSLSYTLRSFHKKTISLTCPVGMFICWFYFYFFLRSLYNPTMELTCPRGVLFCL